MKTFHEIHASNPYKHLIDGTGPHDAALVRRVFSWTHATEALEAEREAYQQVQPDFEAEQYEHLEAIRHYAEQIENAPSADHVTVLQKHQAEHIKAYERMNLKFRLDGALRRGQDARARLDAIEAELNALAGKPVQKPVASVPSASAHVQRLYQALSLWQPWATLIMLRAKVYETRHWKPRQRGLLAIHAAKRWTREEQNIVAQPVFQAALGGIETLPLGAMLGIVRIVDVFRTEEIAPRLSKQELAFGNSAPGRFAWQLEVVEVFAEPISAKGAQNIFEWERAS